MAEGDACVEKCLTDRYVSKNRVCMPCDGSSQCAYKFTGDLQVTQGNPLVLVLYFNQRADTLTLSQVKTTIKNTATGTTLYTEKQADSF